MPPGQDDHHTQSGRKGVLDQLHLQDVPAAHVGCDSLQIDRKLITKEVSLPPSRALPVPGAPAVPTHH